MTSFNVPRLWPKYQPARIQLHQSHEERLIYWMLWNLYDYLHSSPPTRCTVKLQSILKITCHISAVICYIWGLMLSSSVPTEMFLSCFYWVQKGFPTVHLWSLEDVFHQQHLELVIGFSKTCFTFYLSARAIVWRHRLNVFAGKLWSRSVKVAYNLLHKLGTKQEPLVRPGDRVSEAKTFMMGWDGENKGADFPRGENECEATIGGKREKDLQVIC